MIKTENRNKNLAVKLKPLCIGIALGLLLSMLVLFIGAFLIAGEKLSESFGRTVVYAAALSGAFTGGLFVGKQNKGTYALNGLLTGAGLFCIRLIAAAFCNNGRIVDGRTAWMLCFLLTGGVFGGLMAGKKRIRRRK